MPKVPVDYSQTCIYKLVHFDDLNDNNIYVGHTTNMTKRKWEHKKTCCNPNSKGYNHKKYQFIRGNGGWDKWQMILVEKYPCKCSAEAIARERYWVKELKATLNSNEPGRTQKEWYEDNREKVCEQRKEYREANRDKLAEINKEYREANRDKLAEKKKEYYDANRDKIAEKITCDCGSVIRSGDIARHRKSIKHQDWLKNNNLTIN
jgi:hypothetical protein